MSIVALVFSVVLWVVGGYLLLNVVYLLLFALAGHRRLAALPSTTPAGAARRMCVLLPAYQADGVVLETAPAAAAHAYAGVADVHVIADGLLPATVLALRAQGVGVVEVAFVKSTKGQALLAALNALPAGRYDTAVILDVDNVMAPGFLTQVDQAFGAGYRAVQGHRTAKNMDSAFAVLDACNEEINNHLFRRGHVALGLSAGLIGSGMAFEYELLRHHLQNIGQTSGEDKELDFCLLRDGVKIAYLPEAYVLDEKVPNAQVFTTQRTRWMAAQLEFLQKHLAEGPRQLLRGNVEFFDKVVQTLLLPRILLLGALGLGLLATLLGWPWGPSAAYWALLLAGTGAALLLSLPGRLYNRQVGQAVLHLPVALGAMLLALLQIGKAKHSFMATPHQPHAAGPAPSAPVASATQETQTIT